MTKTIQAQGAWVRWMFLSLLAAGFLGAAFLAAVAALGFEEADSRVLALAAVLMMSAPGALLLHVLAVPDLAGAERRTWLRALTGPRMTWALSAYMRCRDRGALARRMARHRAAGAAARPTDAPAR